MKKVLVCLLSMAFVLAMGGLALAKVTGRCDICHTMHNSQGGAVVSAGGPWDNLLVTNCAGCHTGTNTAATTIPYVYSTTLPTFGFGGAANTLAGGNFYWVKQTGGDTKGHNVLDLGILQDANITVAEGAPGNQYGGACQSNGCHGTLAVEQTAVTGLKSGCQGCHLKVRHHADDGTGTKYVDTAAKGWYRFLSGHMGAEGAGVKGIEHAKWNYGATAALHNEYLGVPVTKTGSTTLTNGSMTAYCSGCHGNFHVQNTKAATGAGSQSPWLRHPSDFVLPNAGEYASISTTYDLLSPVARPVAFTGWGTGTPSGTVAVGTDMVMCLSCHVPHGSPNDDLLRWPYAGMVAGGGGPDTGCFYCHTTKN